MAATLVNENFVKQVLYVSFLIVMTGAVGYENDVTMNIMCDNSSMQVYMNFSRPFDGVVYSRNNHYNPLCSFIAPLNATSTEVTLNLPFIICGNNMERLHPGFLVSNLIVIQQHRMIPTRFDHVRNVSCEPDISLKWFRDLQDSIPIEPTTRKAVPWLEMEVGSDLFQETNDTNVDESALYIVLKVADNGVNLDMVVRYCIAHDRRFISNDTILYQMSDFYGCDDDSSILEKFTVTNESGAYSNIMAYAKVRNFSLVAKGKLFITCGVNFCKTTCPMRCDSEESQRLQGFSSVAFKKVVNRPSGATTPNTLQIADEPQTAVKRSVGVVYKNMFDSEFISGWTDGLQYATEASTSESDFYSKQNESDSEVEFEIATPSERNVTAIFPEQRVVLNQTKLLESEVNLNVSTETYLRAMEHYSPTNVTANRSKSYTKFANKNTLLINGELLIFMVCCFMIVSWAAFCYTRKSKSST